MDNMTRAVRTFIQFSIEHPKFLKMLNFVLYFVFYLIKKFSGSPVNT